MPPLLHRHKQSYAVLGNEAEVIVLGKFLDTAEFYVSCGIFI